ncbi:MAG: Fe-S cluster assembly protein SufD [Crocinitomicaceae bacterium]
MNDTLTIETAGTFAQNWTETNLPFSAKILSEAKTVLENTPFPTTRTEAWKYTRVTKISKSAFQNSASTLANVAPFNVLTDAITLVFVNGHFQKDLSSNEVLDGLTISNLAACSDEQLATLGEIVPLENEVFSALNTLYANDGVFIHVQAGKILSKSIQVLFIQDGDSQQGQIRNFISVEKNAQAHVVMGYFSADATDCFSNSLTEVHLADNANLTIDKIQLENETALQIATEQVNQTRDSIFTINTVTLDGLLVRNNLNIAVNGQNCNTHLNGIYLTKGRQHVDNHTVVDHRVPNCESFELYKGVMDENSTAVFNGKVFVRKDAQKINAFQSNGNVLLSDNATINSKPELEIYADDVKCSHGSTTGQLDEEAVFYLRARGISEKTARHLMISAFVGDALEKIENEEVLNFVEGILATKFGFSLH